jgi:cytochrome c551/c552
MKKHCLQILLHAFTLLSGLAGAASLQAAPAQASQQMVADMGCYNCHAASANKHTPTMARLTERAAAVRGDEAGIKKLAEKLRAPSTLHAIAAHERLSPETAELLIRWLSEGAP